MRTCILLIFISSFTLVQLFSQSEADSGMYNKGLDMLKKANTADNYLETAFYFENLIREFPEQWLVHYYAGLSYLLASQKALDSKYKDELLDRVQPHIEKSFLLKPAEPELYILQAFLYQARLQVDPQGRAMHLAPKADASLKMAIERDSTNPRAYFLQANNIYYTPPMFKGGPKNALPVFLKAKKNFSAYRPGLSFFPNWGEQQNEEMIRVCQNQKKQL